MLNHFNDVIIQEEKYVENLAKFDAKEIEDIISYFKSLTCLLKNKEYHNIFLQFFESNNEFKIFTNDDLNTIQTDILPKMINLIENQFNMPIVKDILIDKLSIEKDFLLFCFYLKKIIILSFKLNLNEYQLIFKENTNDKIYNIITDIFSIIDLYGDESKLDAKLDFLIEFNSYCKSNFNPFLQEIEKDYDAYKNKYISPFVISFKIKQCKIYKKSLLRFLKEKEILFEEFIEILENEIEKIKENLDKDSFVFLEKKYKDKYKNFSLNKNNENIDIYDTIGSREEASVIVNKMIKEISVKDNQQKFVKICDEWGLKEEKEKGLLQIF